MLKKVLTLIFAGLILVNIYGCFALFAGAAGGAGTAVWLSGKLTQAVNGGYAQTIQATESALKSLNLEIEKEDKKQDVTTFRSHYTDGKEIWIDVRRINDNTSKVEVRVGALSADKDVSAMIMQKIKDNLPVKQ